MGAAFLKRKVGADPDLLKSPNECQSPIREFVGHNPCTRNKRPVPLRSSSRPFFGRERSRPARSPGQPARCAGTDSHTHRTHSTSRARMPGAVSPVGFTPRDVKPQPRPIPSKPFIPLPKNFAPISRLFLPEAHTKNISLRSAPTGPRLGHFSFRRTAPCRALTHPRHISARTPARSLQYFPFPHLLCRFRLLTFLFSSPFTPPVASCPTLDL